MFLFLIIIFPPLPLSTLPPSSPYPQVLPITDVSNSSVAKGETLEDTVRCLQSYCDVLVLRHPVVWGICMVGTCTQPFHICLQSYCDVLVLRHPVVWGDLYVRDMYTAIVITLCFCFMFSDWGGCHGGWIDSYTCIERW